MVPLPEAQRVCKCKERALTETLVSKQVTVQIERQTFLSVRTEQYGLMVEEPNNKLFITIMCLVGTDLVQVTPHTDFQILLSNVEKH